MTQSVLKVFWELAEINSIILIVGGEHWLQMTKERIRERRIRTDLDTGVDFEEVYRRNGKLHRDPKEGPALTLRNRATGLIENEEYYWHGRLHREGGPAWIRRRIARGTNEMIVEEDYRRHGRRHRDTGEGPAELRRNETTGIVLHQSYYENNELHRDPAKGPAAISCDGATGNVVSEAYWIRDRLHRDPADGPAVIERHPATSAVTRERYFVDGEEVPAPQRPDRIRPRTGPDRDLSC